jgi:hypothetical protein
MQTNLKKRWKHNIEVHCNCAISYISNIILILDQTSGLKQKQFLLSKFADALKVRLYTLVFRKWILNYRKIYALHSSWGSL